MDSFSSPVPVEELDLYIREVRSSSPELPPVLSEDAPELLAEKRKPVLQRFFRLVIGEPRNGLSATPSGLSPQLWNLFLAYADKREYDLRTASAVWINTIHPPSCPKTRDMPAIPNENP